MTWASSDSVSKMKNQTKKCNSSSNNKKTKTLNTTWRKYVQILIPLRIVIELASIFYEDGFYILRLGKIA